MTDKKGYNTKYAAFLRGINIGGSSVIKMSRLRKVFESLGFTGVKTVLASGNVVFKTPEADPEIISLNITKKLSGIFGREVAAAVRPVSDLLKLEASRPFRDAGTLTDVFLSVTFLPEKISYKKIPAELKDDNFDVLTAKDGIMCSVLRERPGIGAAYVMGIFEKKFGKKITTRNWKTIERVIKSADDNA